MILSCATVEPLPSIERIRGESLPRIGVRTNSRTKVPEFYSKVSKRRFYPQGVNWVRLDKFGTKKADNISFHSKYFRKEFTDIKKSVNEMAQFGYNLIRIRIDGPGITGPKNSIALNTEYMENLLTFIAIANKNKMYIMITGHWMPENYYQVAFSGKFPAPHSQTADLNQILMSQGYIEAYARYESDLVRYIKDNAPELSSTIFSIDLWNELDFLSNELPFTLRKGTVKLDSGKNYDMSNPISRQKMADDTTFRWINTVIRAIKSVDAQVLVTSSVFSPKEVRRQGYDGVYLEDSMNGDWRQPFRLSVIEKTDVDYLQIHPYPHEADYDLKVDLESLEFSKLKRTKPILIGEFGAYKKDFDTPEKALVPIERLIAQACRYGIDGWVYWTWDTHEQTWLWNMSEKNGFLAKNLSPLKINWCQR